MMVFTNVYTVVDGLFVSNFVGADAVAATNLIFPLIMVLGSLGFMIGAGGSALVSKTLGEGNPERANAYFSMLVYVMAGVGVVIAVAGQFVVPPVAELLTTDEITYNYCVLYGRVLLGAQPLFILQNIFQSFFVAAEKPHLGLIITAAAGVTNMALDALFVAGFKWGLAGAAAATAAAQLVGGIVPLVYFLCPNGSLLRLTKTKFYGMALLKSCTNGSSELLSNISAAVIMFLYNYQLQKITGGNDGVAAYGAIGYMMMVFFSMFMGYAVGSAPLIAYNYGAQNREELKNLFKKSMIVVALTGLLMTGLSEGLSYWVVRIFGFEEELFAMTLRGFRIYSVAYLICGFGVFGSSMFTALNNGLVSGIISFVRTLVLQVAAILLLPLIWGLDGVWIATFVAEFASLIVTAGFIIGFRKVYGYA